MPPQIHPPDPSQELTPAIAYIRVSLAREEMISPDLQKASISQWARAQRRRITDWVPDLDASGRNIKRKIMGVIARIEAGEAREIVVYRYDRWGRNTVESLANIRRVEQAGGSVISATEPIDPETAMGRYNRTNALALAEMQSDVISENWKGVMAHRVENQLTPAGTPRFGYVRLGRVPDPFVRQRYRPDPDDREGERYVPDPASSAVLKEMYGLYLKGWGFRRIAIHLTERGERNVRGGPWIDATVRNVLDAGFGAGFLQVHAQACKCDDKGSCRNRIRVSGKQEAVIDADVWEAYLGERESRGRGDQSHSRLARYPLSGLVFCGHCGSVMATQSSSGLTGVAYRCKKWASNGSCDGPFPRRARVEAHVLDWLAEWAADIEQQAALTTARREAAVSADAEIGQLERDLADADAAIHRLLVQKAVAGARFPDAAYESASQELADRREAAVTRLRAARKVSSSGATEFLPLVTSILASWDTMPAPDRREILGKLICRVEVSRGGADYTITVIPSWGDQAE